MAKGAWKNVIQTMTVRTANLDYCTPWSYPRTEGDIKTFWGKVKGIIAIQGIPGTDMEKSRTESTEKNLTRSVHNKM